MKMRYVRKTVLLSLLLSMVFLFAGVRVQASEEQSQELIEAAETYQDKLKEMVSGLEEGTVKEIFSFLREKAANGGLETKEEYEKAIQEGKERFGVEIEEQYIEEMLGLATKLEDMGFDSEKLIQKAESLYQQYGADFVEHTQEIVVETVKESIGAVIQKAVAEFFRILGKSVGEFFANLF